MIFRDADDLLTEMLGFTKEDSSLPIDTTRRRSKNANDAHRVAESQVMKIENRHLHPLFADSASSCDSAGRSQASDSDATLAYGDATEHEGHASGNANAPNAKVQSGDTAKANTSDADATQASDADASTIKVEQQGVNFSSKPRISATHPVSMDESTLPYVGGGRTNGDSDGKGATQRSEDSAIQASEGGGATQMSDNATLPYKDVAKSDLGAAQLVDDGGATQMEDDGGATQFADDPGATQPAHEEDLIHQADEAGATQMADDEGDVQMAGDGGATQMADERGATQIAGDAGATQLADEGDVLCQAAEAGATQIADDGDATQRAYDALQLGAMHLAGDAGATQLADEGDFAQANEGGITHQADEAGATQLAYEAGATQLADESCATQFADEGATQSADESGATQIAEELGATQLADELGATQLADESGATQPADESIATQVWEGADAGQTSEDGGATQLCEDPADSGATQASETEVQRSSTTFITSTTAPTPNQNATTAKPKSQTSGLIYSLASTQSPAKPPQAFLDATLDLGDDGANYEPMQVMDISSDTLNATVDLADQTLPITSPAPKRGASSGTNSDIALSSSRDVTLSSHKPSASGSEGSSRASSHEGLLVYADSNHAGTRNQVPFKFEPTQALGESDSEDSKSEMDYEPTLPLEGVEREVARKNLQTRHVMFEPTQLLQEDEKKDRVNSYLHNFTPFPSPSLPFSLLFSFLFSPFSFFIDIEQEIKAEALIILLLHN